MQTTTFKALLQDYARHARQSYAGLSTDDQELLCGDLNAAARWLWEETHSVALPDMLTSKTVTLATGGVIAAADVEDATFWSVWREDPRTVKPGTWMALMATGLGNGDVKVHDKAAGDSVFVFYKSPVLRWTTDRLEEASYPEGALAWFEAALSGDFTVPNGHVYRNITTGLANWDDLLDTASWLPVSVPVSLVNLLILAANEERLRLGSDVPGQASQAKARRDEAFDKVSLAASADPASAPWLCNSNS